MLWIICELFDDDDDNDGPQMRVTDMQRLHEGRGRGKMENPSHYSHPTWREKRIGVLNANGIAGWQVARRMMTPAGSHLWLPRKVDLGGG